jgi:hypothetical protein
MALFTRRVLQRLIFENAAFMTEPQCQRHADAINKGGRASLATEWEVATLNALSKRMRIEHEVSSGARMPDVVAFLREADREAFVADITTVTEAGRDEQNPVDDFQAEVVRRVRRHRLRPDCFGIQVRGAMEGGVGKEVMRLHLPARGDIRTFVEVHVEPFLKTCASATDSRRELLLQREGVDCTIQYDPKRRYLSGSRPAYTAIYSLTRNPLYNALKKKVDQLAGSGRTGPHGVIVCAGDFDVREQSHRSFGTGAIIAEAFRQYSRLSFVLMIWSEDRIGEPCPIRCKLFRSAASVQPLSDEASALLAALGDAFPLAVNSGINALYELDDHYSKRWHFSVGSFSMSNTEIKLSARTLLELLAGRITLDDFLDRHGRDRGWVPMFEQKLRTGQLLIDARIERLPEGDDDWVVFRFSDWDPATGLLRARAQPLER